MLTMRSSEVKEGLHPLPEGHGFVIGERVTQPVYGDGRVSGRIEYIDFVDTEGRVPVRYRGLVMLGDDGRYYELRPEIAKKI